MLDDHDPLLTAVSAVVGEPMTPANIIAVLRARAMHYLARRLHARIAQCSAPGDVRACLDAVDALPETAASELLRAPALCELLRVGGTDAQLRGLLAHDDPGGAQGRWSVLGDFWFGREPPVHGLARGHDDHWHAPRLRCGVPVDLSLPAALVHPNAGLQRPRALTSPEQAVAVELLDRAVVGLEAAYPLGHRLFTELTSNLALRIDDRRPAECWGASSGIAVGRTAVINCAAADGDGMLAEVLLHEATHCALDCAELTQPLAVFHAAAFAVTVASPWTGAPLFAHAFVHASVVWAVLLRFWVGYSAVHGDRPHALARARFIRRGFAVCDASAPLAALREHLTAAAPDVVRGAWEAVRRLPAEPG